MHLRRLLKGAVIGTGLWTVVLAVALIGGGPSAPEPVAGFNNPFKGLDYQNLPALAHFTASDGTTLAYRRYAPTTAVQGSVTLVHGSSANSQSMHVLAQALQAAGQEVWSLDIRGHGASGTRGQIDAIGQLEADMADFMAALRPASPATLLGFSSGGGFALRMAGSRMQDLFGSYVLLAPFIGHNAPTQKPSGGGWVDVGMPRIVALTVLNTLGIRVWNDLPVVAFALSPESRALLTPTYNYPLVMNFRPETDYLATLQRVRHPVAVLAGDQDEAFDSEALPPLLASAGQRWPVQVLPGLNHIALILEPQALSAVVQQVKQVQQLQLAQGMKALEPVQAGHAGLQSPSSRASKREVRRVCT